MNKNEQLHQLKLADWTSRFQDQLNSGLSVRNWCLQNNISIHSYNYWKHKLKQEYLDSVLPNDPDIVPLFPQTVSASAPSPAPCTPDVSRELRDSSDSYYSRDSLNTTPLVVLIGDLRMEFPSSISDDQLFRLIKAVRHA